MSVYTVVMPYTEFQEYLCEGIMTAQFNKHVDECGNIEIEYKYGKYQDGNSHIRFRIPGEEKCYWARYTSSSCFAMWWCGLTDGLEESESESE